jgi:hypothetical protein
MIEWRKAMGVLQDEFDRMIAADLTEEAMKKSVLARALKRHAVELSEDQLRKFIASIESTKEFKLEYPITIDGSSKNVELSDDDLATAQAEFGHEFDQRIEKTIQTVLEEIPKSVLASLYTTANDALHDRRVMRHGFERRLRQHWGSGLKRLEMLIIVAQESGETFLKALHPSKVVNEYESGNENLHLLEALVGLHVRACRTASEVLYLLHGGFADGANARWRSLHELAVVSMFLAQYGNETAYRYRRHAAVDRFKAMRQYHKHHAALGHEAPSQAEIDKTQADYDRALADFGIDFKHEYGWVASALRRPSPNFAEIEESLDLDRWRPYFKMACQSVHAGSQGLFFSLGLVKGRFELLSGASNAGLADPAHCSAISLTMTTTSLLTTRPDLDRLITCRVMALLTDDVGAAFIEAHEMLEQAEITASRGNDEDDAKS